MSGSNDFLAFATGGGANVISQITYAGLAAVGTGFQAGTANSAQLNKVWRQSSVIAAAIGQLIADAGMNAQDNGNVATIEEQLAVAVDLARYAVDSGAANAYAAAYAPAVLSVVDGMVLRFRAANSNTGASTFNPNALGAVAIVGANHQALRGGEIVSGADVWLQYNSTLASWVLMRSSAAQPPSGVVGAVRNARMVVVAANASATFTADEVIVANALGGVRYCLPSFNQNINLATNGAGGMDTGAAPASGFVALYAIYNPVAKTSALLAVNATAAAAPPVYGGANMPAGYTASGLVSVWPTDGTGKLKVGAQLDRRVTFPLLQALSTNASTGAVWTSLSLASIVPANAKSISGTLAPSNSSSASQNTSILIASDSNGSGRQDALYALTSTSGGGLTTPFSGLLLSGAQTIYYQTTTTAGTPSYTININGYEF